MSLLDFFRKKSKEDVKDRVPLFEAVSTLFSSLTGGSNSSGDLYRGWVFGAVNAIAEEYSSIDLRLMKNNKNGDKEQVFDHPADKLLNYVNEGFTRDLLFFRLGANLELEGKEYWLILRNGLNQPGEIMPLQPWRVKILLDEYNTIIGYRYNGGNGTSYTFAPDQIVMFRNFNPKDDYEGMSTLEAARLPAETDEAAKLYDRQFMRNFARPDVILKFDTTLTKEQKAKLKEQWKQEYGGPRNAGKMLIAPKGMEVDTFNVNHADMEYVEKRKYTRDEILGIFKVPKIMLGVTEDINRATADAAIYIFQRLNTIPKMRRAASFLTEFYLPLFADTEGMYYEIGNKPTEDPIVTAEYYSSGINNGWLSVNEVRRAESRPEVENGDQLFIGFGLSPFADVAKEMKRPLPPVKPEVKSVTIEDVAKSFSDVFGKSLKARTKHIEEADEDKEDLPAPQETPQQRNRKDPEFETKGQARTAKQDELLKPFEDQYKAAAEGLFEDQKKRAIAALKKSDVGKSSFKKKADILDPNQEIKLTIDIFAPLFKELAKVAGDQALQDVGVDNPFDTDLAAEFIRKNALRFAKELTTKTATDLRNLIAAGVSQGETINELTARISEYSGFGEARAETIARTETIRGGAQSDLEAWKQSGVVSKAIWYTALDERVDPDCEFLHGNEVDLGAEFLSEDQLLEFGLEPYGGGVNAPPLHPNCRCVLLPVVDQS